MIIHDVIQNTPEWRQLRAGIPTASAMDRIVTKSGKPSSQAEKYKFQLLAERIMGRPLDDNRFTWAMERGSDLEKKALQYYSFQTDYQTTPVGFITDDRVRWGASPDQLIGEHGLLEVKSPDIAAHMMYLMHDGAAYDEYKVQAQSQLWICERQWVDFLSYHPDLPWALVRISRNEGMISVISSLVAEFSIELQRLSIYAKEQGWFRSNSVREPKLSAQDELIKAMKESLIATK